MENKNVNLAIAIPTYNRAAILKENLLLMLDEIIRNHIPIYISDDSSNEETRELFLELKNIYPFIYYKKNTPALGHDKNCISTLQFPSENYVWYIGDSTIIEAGGIEIILENISQNGPEAIGVNALRRNLSIESTCYTDANILLKDLAWHLTLTGATIYSKKLIMQNAQVLNLASCVNFPQLALLFKGFEKGPCKFYWENKKLITNNAKKNSYWQKNLFKVFLHDWPNCVDGFEFLDKKIRHEVIINHSRRTELFTLKSLVSYRVKGFFGIREFVTFFKELKAHSSSNIIVLLTVTLIPQFLFSLLNKMRKF